MPSQLAKFRQNFRQDQQCSEVWSTAYTKVTFCFLLVNKANLHNHPEHEQKCAKRKINIQNVFEIYLFHVKNPTKTLLCT